MKISIFIIKKFIFSDFTGGKAVLSSAVGKIALV